MRSFVPRAFRPNRQHKTQPAAGLAFRDHVPALRAAFEVAADRNLKAVLVEAAPVALEAQPFIGMLGATDEDPLAGYVLEDWSAGRLPNEDFALRLIAEPGRAMAIAAPRSDLGAALTLPSLMHTALGDGALRHRLAEECRRFLCDKVLFHPGPPPAPAFSVAALTQLCLSQPAHLAAIQGRVRTALQKAASQVIAEAEAASPWDQWLYRRIDAAAGWHLAEGLSVLPWVAWRRGDPLPDPAGSADLPGYWLSLIDLEP